MRLSFIWPLVFVAALLAAAPAGAATPSSRLSSPECQGSVDTLADRLAALPETTPIPDVLQTVQDTSGEPCGFNIYDPSGNGSPSAPSSQSSGGAGCPMTLIMSTSTTLCGGVINIADPPHCPIAGSTGQNSLDIHIAGEFQNWAEGSHGHVGYASDDQLLEVSGHGPLTSVLAKWRDGGAYSLVARIGGVVVPFEPQGPPGVECGKMNINCPLCPDPWVEAACRGDAYGLLLPQVFSLLGIEVSINTNQRNAMVCIIG